MRNLEEHSPPNRILRTSSDPDITVDSELRTILDGTRSSLPEISIETNEEQLTLLQEKIAELTSELRSAHEEIESLTMENSDLKKTNEDLLRKNELYKKVASTPPTKNTTLTQKRENENLKQDLSLAYKETEHINFEIKNLLNELQKSREIIDGYRKVDSDTETAQISRPKNKNKRKKKARNSILLSPSVSLSASPGDTDHISHHQGQSNGLQRETMTTNTQDPIPKNSVINQSDSTFDQPEVLTLSPKPFKQKRQLLLVSSNNQDKIRETAENQLSSDFQTCHYLIPEVGIRELFNGLADKTKSLSKNDFCVILIGEEDFKKTNNYCDLVIYIRQATEKILNTNILICLPTYKYSEHLTMFNWRVETFNNLLYLDVTTHEHVFLMDSNENLNFDYSMFSKLTRRVNSVGIKTIFYDIYSTLLDIIPNLITPINSQSPEKIQLTLNQIFFRE